MQYNGSGRRRAHAPHASHTYTHACERTRMRHTYRPQDRQKPPPWPSGKGRGTPWPCSKLRCAGGREFDPRPGQYSRMSFSSDPGDWYGFLIWTCLSIQILNLFRTLSSWGSGNYRPTAPLLYEVASHVKKLPFRPLLLLLSMPQYTDTTPSNICDGSVNTCTIGDWVKSSMHTFENTYSLIK